MSVSNSMPRSALASAHCSFKCALGTIIIIFLTFSRLSNFLAQTKANVVFPAPGVATQRKFVLSFFSNLSSNDLRALACHGLTLYLDFINWWSEIRVFVCDEIL